MALADSGTLSEAPGVKRSGSFLVNIHFFANYKKLIHIQTSKSQPKKEVSRNGCGENHIIVLEYRLVTFSLADLTSLDN